LKILERRLCGLHFKNQILLESFQLLTGEQRAVHMTSQKRKN
jgi:hypothetical protein